ncbi:MAG: T9SS type B sorting domain-containing protein [Nonlabens sp.]
MRNFNILILFFFFIPIALSAQQVNMQDGTTTYTGCSGIGFFDSGGRGSNYGSNEDNTSIFCPAIDTDRMQLEFFRMDLGPGDTLTILDGNGGGPVLGTFSNTTVAPGLFQASASSINPSGCLTVRFTSNGSGSNAGWEAARSCFDPCQEIIPVITTMPASGTDGILRIVPNTIVTFTATANFEIDGTGATYTWNLGNGGPLQTGQTVSTTYTGVGVFQVQLTVEDVLGCTDRTPFDLTVQVAPIPIFTGTAASETEICLGESVTLTGVVTQDEFVQDVSPPVAGETFLPDGNGVSYTTCINVDLFAPGTIVQQGSDLSNIFANLEHSWINDLEIIITAPSGQSVVLLPQPNGGGGNFFGDPIDDDTNLDPGVGAVYNFNQSAGQTIVQALPGSPQTLPPGSYLPEEPFSNLVGSSLNGQWCLTVTDNIGSDNGYIFEWGLDFNPNIIPDELSFQPEQTFIGWQGSPPGEIATVTPAAEGVACYTLEYTSNHLNSAGDFAPYFETVCITVNPGIDGGSPDDLVVCDDTGMVTTVDLTQNDVLILNGQDPNDFEINYYILETDAQDGVNEINNPTAFTFSRPTQTIFSMIMDPVTGCTLVDEFEVGAIEFEPFTITDIDNCDPIIDFTLDDYVRNQLPASLNTVDFNINYYTDLGDATAASNPIVAPTSYSQSPGTVEIFVRIDAAVDADCNVIESFTITVSPLSDLGVGTRIEQCDDFSGDGIEAFDLTINDSDILNGIDPMDVIISYYNTLADAQTPANPIGGVNYQNTNLLEDIFVRVEYVNDPDCFNTASFQIEVFQIPQISRPDDINICDDITGDGFEEFNLALNEGQTLTGLNPVDYDVQYFISRTDAESNANATSAIYTNSTTPEAVFVRVEDNATGCVAITEFEINVSPVPDPGTPDDLSVCANDTTAFGVFDLSDNNDAIIDGQADVVVTYHDSFNNAELEAGLIGPDNYSSMSNMEEVFYRSEFSTTGCFTIGSFMLNTLPPPAVVEPADVVLCEDSDGNATIDLTTLNDEITNNDGSLTVSYYLTQVDADEPVNAIVGDFDFNSSMTLFVRVEENINNCPNFTQLNLIINRSPSVGTPVALDLNDDLLDDGTELFDLTQNNGLLLDGLNPAEYDITYYLNETDAIIPINPVGPSYSNSGSPELIYVRVENIATGCFSISQFEIIVNPIPDIVVSDTIEECDQDGNGTATFILGEKDNELRNGQIGISIDYYTSFSNAENDIDPLDASNYTNASSPQTIYYRISFVATGAFNVGEFQIDTVGAPIAFMPDDIESCDNGSGLIEVDLTSIAAIVTQGDTDLLVSYYLTQDDADVQANPLPLLNEFSQDTNLIIRVDDDNTDCVSFTSLNILFNELPQPQLFNQFLLCIAPDGTLLNGPTNLDTGLDESDFSFQWFLNGDELMGEMSSTYDATVPGDYQVNVVDIITGCETTASTNVRQSGIPSEYDVTILTQPYDKIHNVLATASGTDRYIFRLDDGPYVNNGFFGDVEPGVHTVTIAEASGCGEIVEDIFVFGYPDFFTPNFDGFNDKWNIVNDELLPNTRLFIFNRFGKLVKQINPGDEGWDGTFNGENLPSSDYWFKIEYERNGITAEATGHFALKR